jgi:hypothetical protein
MKKSLLIAVVQAAALALLSFSSMAQTEAPPDAADPPDRAGRLSYVQGAVSLQPAGQDQWTAAEVNRPLTTGDKLWTDRGSRAELYAGGAAIRLSGETGFSFLNFDDNTVQMRMTAGTVDVRVKRLDADDHIELDTPNAALSLLRPGNYRVEVNDAGDATVVKISEGEAEVSGGGAPSVVVHAQQAATFHGTEQLASDFGTLGAPDDFDSWCLDRDQRDERATAATAQYVSPDVVGSEDLNEYGSWSNDPEYGYVWSPTTVAVGWAPYHYGRWVWVSPWGWTWLDEAPWGFAPFHYGRWAFVRERWCWVPGPRHVRPVYAPALVAWVGGSGFDVSVSAGGGGVAWFPLAPREVYVPAYRVSPRYVTRVNVTNTVVNNVYVTNVYEKRVTNVTYRNRVVPGAVITVPRNSFVSAEPVARHAIRMDERVIARGQVMSAAPAIRPEPRSVLGMSDQARRTVRTPPAALANREVVARRAPPATSERFVKRTVTAPARVDRPDRVNEHQAPNASVAARRDAGERAGDRERQGQNNPSERAPQVQRTAPVLRNDRPPAAQARAADEAAHRAQADQAQRDREQAARARAEQSQRDRMQAERAESAQTERERAQQERTQAAQAEQERARMARSQEEQSRRERELTARTQEQQAQRERDQAARAQAQQAQRERAQAEREEQRRAAAAQENAQRERLAQHADRPRPADRPERAPPAQKPDHNAENKRPDSNRNRPNDNSSQPQ